MKQQITVPLDNLFQNLQDQPFPVASYANHARITLMGNELYLDFILVSPEVTSITPQAAHIQRIIYPLSQARSLADALNTVVTEFESEDIPDETQPKQS